ncbi:AAA family ATPase [Nioella sp.]|uniref:nucleotide-binding protein n=1 Tax=Nioella sp. TaxID=1912091 RepID=UPI003A85EDDF
MKRIFFIHGDKGGVGKTEVAKRMAAVMLQAGRAVTLVDGDNKNPGLHAAFEKSELDVQCINVMTPAGRDTLFDVIAESPGDVLIDLPARGSDVTERLNRDGASEDGFSLELLLREIDAELRILFVIDQTRPPLAALRDELKALPATTSWIIVRNWREERDFDLFDKSKTKADLDARGAPIIDLVRLDPRANDILENEGLNLISAQTSDKLSMLQKMRVKAAIRSWSEQMKIAGLIE